jgi:endonuclease/exonuclease/phosphatase (EEP) superfamily protein YafD
MVRMYFIHLNTFGLSDNDKAYIEEIKNNTMPANSLGHSRSFVWKFNYAFTRRAAIADKAANIIRQSPYPVFICGDFNDLPASYTYNRFKGTREDAFLKMGNGFGRTYNQISPTLRIDHIFYDPSVLKIVGIDCPGTNLSDHNPVIANFEIIPKAKN